MVPFGLQLGAVALAYHFVRRAILTASGSLGRTVAFTTLVVTVLLPAAAGGIIAGWRRRASR